MKRDPPRPWGKLAGLLAACAVTLYGVVIDLDPIVILQRAAGAGCCCGIVAAVASYSIRMFAQQRRVRTTA